MSRRGTLIAVSIFGFFLGGVVGHLSGKRGGYAPPAGRPNLEEETLRLETEYPLAAAKKPYLILDLPNSRLDYRLSGMTIKSLPFQIDSILERGKEAVLSWGHLMLIDLEDRGAPPEVIVPPDPSKPVDPLKDPKLFPPDPPTDFTLLFEQPVKVRILGEESQGWRSKMQGVGRAVTGWLPWGPGGGKKEIRIQLRLPAELAREIYRALYRREKVLLLGLGSSSGVPLRKAGTR